MHLTAALSDPVTGSLERVVGVLDDAFRSECRLLNDLISLLRRQRRAVAEDDLGLVDETVHGAQRILLTLGEARRRRRSLLDLLGGTPEASLGELEDLLGDRMTEELRTSREDLRESARRLSQELRVNREILERAIRSGESYVRSLYGDQAAGYGGYGPDAAASRDTGGGGRLLNRTV